MIERANVEPGVKEKILESALESFATKGYHGTSVKEIATDAGVNKSLLFYYFNSKENLYKSIIHYAAQKAKFLYEEVDKAKTFREKFDNVIGGYIRFFSETKHVPGIVLQSIFGMGPDLSLSLEEMSAYVRKPLINLLNEGIAAGELAEINAEIVAKAIMGMISAFFIHMPCRPDYQEDEIRKNIQSLIVSGIYVRN
ncbi:MAG: TetR/AcrR family transcriptional regulator [Firmicutes bacterium]|nr:TetR/AcrR family transcriptional regulator [Bacillota bacterium]